MSRYKIVKMDNEISAKEVEGFKNFDALLKSHKKSVISKRLLLGLVPASVMVSIAFYFYFTSFNQPSIVNIEPSPKENTQIAKIGIDSIQNSDTSDTVVVKLKSIDKNQKKNNPVAKTKFKKESVLDVKQEYIFIKAAPDYGLDSLVNYLIYELNKKRLPQTSGNIVVAFTINAAGHPNTIKIIQGLSKELDAEIIQLISEMPDWQPAIMNGKTISSTTTLPIKVDIKSEPLN